MSDPHNPFSLQPALANMSPGKRALLTPIARCAESLLALRRLGTMYARVNARCQQNPQLDFLDTAFAELDVSYEVTSGTLSNIPKTGPFVVVANHPFGGIEGTILIHLIRQVRPDFKIMANFILGGVPQLRDYFIFVDPFGAETSFRKNLRPLRETMEWLTKGHVIGVFPSGTVSHLDLSKRTISDPVWSPTVAGIIRKCHVPVLPIFFNGFNGPLFQFLGVIHPRLRTLMLPRQLLKAQHSTIRLAIGTAIPPERMVSFRSDEDLMSYLRVRTYILEDREETDRRFVLRSFPRIFRRPKLLRDIAAAQDRTAMFEEISRLPANQRLIENGELEVYFGRATQIPTVLKEIGRLRELTFRKAHEGTGKEIDLDRFDNYYIHLFLWNKEKYDIVGAYRLGKTDRIMRRFGVQGLYTHTLFNYGEKVMRQIGPALELGRSFVRPDYQKGYLPLLLLWKGIGQYVVRNPRYKMLFGPVSINAEYESLSRELIVAFLTENNFLHELGNQIKARNPIRKKPFSSGLDSSSLSMVVRDVKEVNELISEIEEEQKAIPVLLRQYLRLGGKMIGFNVDKDFGDVLDGLILVDMTETDPKLLERYFGKEGSQKFLEFHRSAAAARGVAPSTRENGA